MTLETMQQLWYLVIGLSVVCYVTLDGFDLGVGCVHLLSRKDEERRVFLNAIGPVWDGNAVWIVVLGGALFAGFPDVYATVFSSFYVLSMALLCGFIFRAVAIEFRSKNPSRRWRSTWDIFFSLASITVTFGIGLVLGNFVIGIPLDDQGNFLGAFGDFIHPYSLLLGVFSICLLSMHGSIYLLMKTEGDLHEKLRKWVFFFIGAFIFMYVVVTLATFFMGNHMVSRMKDMPIFLIFPIFTIGCILAVPYFVRKKWDGWAFIFSSFSIAFLLALFAIGTYPRIMLSSIDPEMNSLTIFNSSSSKGTLTVLLIIATIGVPLVLGYGYYVYRVFRGKVKLDKASY